jgi:hypothetical protein
MIKLLFVYVGHSNLFRASYFACLRRSGFAQAGDSNLLQIKLVPRAGLEPAQSHDHEILSLARIPISPPRPVASLALSYGDVAASRFLFVPAPFLQLVNNQRLLVIITAQFITIIHLLYTVNQRKKLAHPQFFFLYREWLSTQRGEL